MPGRSYWYDGSNRRRGEYLQQFKRWAEEDFEQYKRREAAHNEDMERRIAEAWPKIRPWVFWAMPNELQAKQTKKSSASTSHTENGKKSEPAQNTAGDTGAFGKPPIIHSNTTRSPVHIEHPSESPGTLSEYDPITMRRVVKSTSDPTPQKLDAGNPKGAFNIPVKPFIPPSTRPPQVKSQRNTPEENPSPVQQSNRHLEQDTGITSQSPKKAVIENALDRHIRYKHQPKDLKYPQISAEDPNSKDQRASDTRPSPTLKKQPQAGASKPADASSSDLDIRYQNHLQRIEALTADIHDPRRRIRSLHQISSASPRSSKTQATQTRTVSQSPSPSFVSAVEAQVDEARETLANARRKIVAIRQAHAAEVDAQKMTMDELESRPRTTSASPVVSFRSDIVPGEGDMATNVHDFAGRDRWYKQKSRSSTTESRDKAEHFRRDQEFVRGIRNIYEETYGTIDTNHQQLPSETTQTTHDSESLQDPKIFTLSNASSVEDDNRQTTKAIISQLLRSTIEMQSIVSDLCNKNLAASNPYRNLPDSLEQSPQHDSCDAGSITGMTRSPHEEHDEPSLPEGHTVYKILALSDKEGSRLRVTTTTGPAEKPNSRPATIPEISDNLHAPIKPFVKEMEKLMQNGYEPSSSKTRRDCVILRKIQPIGRVVEGLYKVLSFDPETGRMLVTIAKGQGEQSTKKDLTLPAILDEVNHPDKFIPFLADLGKEGWRPAGRDNWSSYRKNKDLLCFWKPGELPEGVQEGTRSILVSKPRGLSKTRDVKEDDDQPASTETVTHEKESKPIPTNLWPSPVDGTLSPTGFVNYESLHPRPLEPEAAAETTKDYDSSQTYPIPLLNSSPSPSSPSSTTKKVRREEPIFSGTYHSPPSSHTDHIRNKHWQPSVVRHGLPPFSRSRRAAKRAAMMQQPQIQQQKQSGGGRFKRVFKRMVWCGIGLVGAFYAVGLGISSLFWIGAVLVPTVGKYI